VRLIDADGENRGVVRLADAQEIAANAGLDLVEVAPDARPPVCRIMDYGKYRYEQEQKAKQARRHQSTITIKEIKFRPKIDPHDYATKKGHVERFLRHRDKVKITIMFRGRELLHPERGEAILLRLAEELSDLAVVESRPNLDGRNMVMMLAPVKNQSAGQDSAGNGRSQRQAAETGAAKDS
jgi:translation initiation factor IF-3